VKRRNKRRLAGLGIVVILGIFLWYYWPGRLEGEPSSSAVVQAGHALVPSPPQPPEAAHVENPTPEAAPPQAEPVEPKPLEEPPVRQRPDGSRQLDQGLRLIEEGRLIAARSALSKALFSGRLAPAEAHQARAVLEDLAERTLFSAELFEGDPYTMQYTFQPGQTLQAVERQLQLHVPPQLILRINGIADARRIRAGQTLKMIQGPFHAIVTKSNFTMDLFLHRPGRERVFVKRLRVGLGKNGTTPEGMWKVAPGKKMTKAVWYPPPNSEHRRAMRPGDPDYPLGQAGYWIGLEGIDENTAGQEGYGIHGTNDPDSIGRAESLGCIRLADPDIELLFALLYEGFSTVEIRP